MQTVPLPQGVKIPAGALVLGNITAVQKPAGSAPGQISFRFTSLKIHNRVVPILTNLRALAGFMDVMEAQTPETSPGFGTPSTWITTRQIGGDQVYGLAGPVTDIDSNTVGQSVPGGVLVRLTSQPDSPCPSDDQPERLQALWVFSSDACGVYGVAGLAILHAGRTAPLGEITLQSIRPTLSLRSSTAILLRTLAPPSP